MSKIYFRSLQLCQQLFFQYIRYFVFEGKYIVSYFIAWEVITSINFLEYIVGIFSEIYAKLPLNTPLNKCFLSIQH